MWNVWERQDVKTDFVWGNLKDEENLEDLDVNGRIILQSKLNN
jgi:hypothetical protein